MATFSQDLPVELPQGILAFTQANKPPPTLIACSAVSWLWRDMVPPQLFSSFNTRRTESFMGVLHFLSTHPHISACVKHITLRRAGSIHTLSDLTKSRLNTVQDHETAHALLKYLPALRELSFHGVKFVGSRVAEPLPPSVSKTDTLGEDHARPHRLQRVALDRCVIGDDPTPHFRILSLYDIDTLELAYIQFPDSEVPQPETLRGTLQTRRLWIWLHSRWGLTSALQRHLELECVLDLSIGCDTGESL